MVYTGIFFNNTKPLSLVLKDILEHNHIQWHPPPIRHIRHTKFRKVDIEYMQRMWNTDRGQLLVQTPGPAQFVIWISCSVHTILYKTCHLSGFISNESLRSNVFHAGIPFIFMLESLCLYHEYALDFTFSCCRKSAFCANVFYRN